MPYMYILECGDGSYYTGSTKDLGRRLWEHRNGIGANHTAKRPPVKLVYCEKHARIDEAFYREKQVQGWVRKKKQSLIAGDTNQLHQLAECRNETHSGNMLPLPEQPSPLPSTTLRERNAQSEKEKPTLRRVSLPLPERSRRQRDNQS